MWSNMIHVNAVIILLQRVTFYP